MSVLKLQMPPFSTLQTGMPIILSAQGRCEVTVLLNGDDYQGQAEARTRKAVAALRNGNGLDHVERMMGRRQVGGRWM